MNNIYDIDLCDLMRNDLSSAPVKNSVGCGWLHIMLWYFIRCIPVYDNRVSPEPLSLRSAPLWLTWYELFALDKRQNTKQKQKQNKTRQILIFYAVLQMMSSSENTGRAKRVRSRDPSYRKISNISRSKSPNVIVPRLVLQLSLPTPIKPGVRSRMKM